MRRPARSRLAATAAALVMAAVGVGSPGAARADTTLTFQPVADAQVYSSHPTDELRDAHDASDPRGCRDDLRTRPIARTSASTSRGSPARSRASRCACRRAIPAPTARASTRSPTGGRRPISPTGTHPTIGGTSLGSARRAGRRLQRHRARSSRASPGTGRSGSGSGVPGRTARSSTAARGRLRRSWSSPSTTAPPPPVKPVAAFSGSPRSGSRTS